MRQGLYTMLAYGTMDVPPELTNDDLENWSQIKESAPQKQRNGYLFGSIKTSYEAEPLYLGIPLAVNDGFLQEWWQLPDLPHGSLETQVSARRVVPAVLKNPPKEIAVAIAAAKKDWLKIQATAKRLGHQLGRGQLLLVSDWD